MIRLGSTRLRRVALFALIGLVGVTVLLFGAGELFSRPATRPIGQPPSDFPASYIRLAVPPGDSIAGWFAGGQAGKGGVLLLHGVRTDRTQMLGRARFLVREGYAALLVDLPAHGESTGERIGIIGVSLGAASTVLAQPRPAPVARALPGT
jgi:dienelactone hydrolase